MHIIYLVVAVTGTLPVNICFTLTRYLCMYISCDFVGYHKRIVAKRHYVACIVLCR